MEYFMHTDTFLTKYLNKMPTQHDALYHQEVYALQELKRFLLVSLYVMKNEMKY